MLLRNHFFSMALASTSLHTLVAATADMAAFFNGHFDTTSNSPGSCKPYKDGLQQAWQQASDMVDTALNGLAFIESPRSDKGKDLDHWNLYNRVAQYLVYNHGKGLQFDPVTGNLKDGSNQNDYNYMKSVYQKMQDGFKVPQEVKTKAPEFHCGFEQWTTLGPDDTVFWESPPRKLSDYIGTDGKPKYPNGIWVNIGGNLWLSRPDQTTKATDYYCADGTFANTFTITGQDPAAMIFCPDFLSKKPATFDQAKFSEGNKIDAVATSWADTMVHELAHFWGGQLPSPNGQKVPIIDSPAYDQNGKELISNGKQPMVYGWALIARLAQGQAKADALAAGAKTITTADTYPYFAFECYAFNWNWFAKGKLGIAAKDDIAKGPVPIPAPGSSKRSASRRKERKSLVGVESATKADAEGFAQRYDRSVERL